MKVKYLNQYKISLEMYKEWSKKPKGKFAIKNFKKGIRLRIGGIISSMVIIILGLLLKEFYAILLGLSFLIIFLLRLFVLPNKILKKQYDSILKNHNYEWIRSFEFSKNIVIKDGNTTSSYEYLDILDITDDEKYYYLFLNEDMVFRIPKDSFIVGETKDFKVFIDNAIKKQ